MANLPKATTVVQDTAGAAAGGLDTVCVLCPVATQADITPRLFGNAKAVFDLHGYSEGVEYCSLHAARTGKPFMFLGLPIATAGVITRENKSGNSGTSSTTVTPGSPGVLAEHEGVLKVAAGGTIGTSQIILDLSMDGGRSFKKVRLPNTATSYAIPFFGVTVSFSAGTLVTGDTIHTWFGTAPKTDAASLTAARNALAAQQRGFRSMLLIGDLALSSEAASFLAELNAYETQNERFVFGRASVRERLPLAAMSQLRVTMTGSPSVTFAEVGASGDTITRATGSWFTDGFAIGDSITVTNTASNNVTNAVIAGLTATVITLGTDDLNPEVTSNAVITAFPTITFAEVGGTGDTITRSRGSWIADGFRPGDKIKVTGTTSNNITALQGLGAVTASVLTLGTDDLNPEVKASSLLSIAAGQTKAEWMSDLDTSFAGIDAAKRIDLSAGRGRVLSPFTSWQLRRPAAWAASLREYQHDLHIATWRKDDGPTGFDLYDQNGALVEWDDRADGSAGSVARFTTMRSWANGPNGAFVALSLTRESDGSLLSLTHNMAVVNLACTTVQLNTEKVIGRSLVLNDNGTATTDSLTTIESEVNAALELALLQNRGEGPRASKAVWTAAKNDILNVPEALLTGVLDLNLNGTVHSVRTAVRVRSGGQ